MRPFLLFIFLLFPVLAQAFSQGDPFQQAEFLPVDKAFTFSSERLASGETRLHWQISEGYYLYQKRLKFDGLSSANLPALPEGEAHSDEFFGDQTVYRHSLELLIPASASGQAKLSWQGCADAGLCYPPQSKVLDLGGSPAAGMAQDQSLADSLQQRAFGWSLLVFFGLGLLLAFTPCSLPMLPILAGVVVGSGASPKRGFALASSYVLSMALVYAGLGVLAALLGGNLQALLQQPWLLGSFAALFVLLALPMFGLFELQLPAFLRDRLENAGRQRSGGNLVGAGVLGALSGLMVGPCMTAPLAGALLYIAQSGNAVHGGLVLFVMGLGIGLPLLLLVTIGNRFMPKPGAWMNRVKAVFGVLLLATAAFIAWPLLDVRAQNAAGHEAFISLNEPTALQRELDAAKAQGQWVLVDYYADWCVSCKIMEKQVFAKPDVQDALKEVRLLKLDVTESNDASRQLLERYKVPGPPSLIWIGPNGEELRDRRITGEVDAETFLRHWQTTRERG
ncbi:MAG: thiol:disulfide interchange protein [Pseudomonas sp.]|nr:thiol:disulfide interchange protein [Pseudomonas sp.]